MDMMYQWRHLLESFSWRHLSPADKTCRSQVAAGVHVRKAVDHPGEDTISGFQSCFTILLQIVELTARFYCLVSLNVHFGIFLIYYFQTKVHCRKK